MIKWDHPYGDESREMGRRYLEDNEGLSMDEYFDKYASPGLKAWDKEQADHERRMREAGYV